MVTESRLEWISMKSSPRIQRIYMDMEQGRDLESRVEIPKVWNIHDHKRRRGANHVGHTEEDDMRSREARRKMEGNGYTGKVTRLVLMTPRTLKLTTLTINCFKEHTRNI